MSPPDPLDVYCDWLAGLGSPMAEDLAIVLTQLFPGERLGSPVARLVGETKLADRLRGLFKAPRRRAGLALSLAAITDFAMEERARPERWDQQQDVLEGLKAAQDSLREAGGEGLGVEVEAWIEDSRLGYPFRARQWMREVERWRALRAEALSVEAISEALSAHTRASLPQLLD